MVQTNVKHAIEERAAGTTEGSRWNTKEETIAKLRERLGREPTEAEINTARNALIRQVYAGMALTAVLFRDDQ
jgi:hypothetical protein